MLVLSCTEYSALAHIIALAGIRGSALIINLPGKPKSIRETFDEVFKSIPYCVQLAGGPYIETHESVVAAFRPPADRRTA
jgi:molybdopterin adenylyltransferase